MKKIMIPVDGSDNSIRAIDKGVEMARLLNGELVIFHAIDNMKFYASTETDEERLDSLKKYSDSILSKAKSYLDGLAFTSYRLASEIGDPTTSICNYASENGMDLIIMGSQGMNAGRLRGILVGSITKKVVACSDIPVMVVK